MIRLKIFTILCVLSLSNAHATEFSLGLGLKTYSFVVNKESVAMTEGSRSSLLEKKSCNKRIYKSFLKQLEAELQHSRLAKHRVEQDRKAPKILAELKWDEKNYKLEIKSRPGNFFATLPSTFERKMTATKAACEDREQLKKALKKERKKP